MFLRGLRPNDQRLSRKTVTQMLLVAAALLGPLHGEVTNEPVLLLGGYFERPPIMRFFPGSKKTLLFPALVGIHGEIIPDKASARRSNIDWDHFVKDFRNRASLLMASLDPVMVRDAHGVIQMAVITGEDPMTASCVLSPGFLPKFSAVFGPELIVAVPTRNRIYVFPKLANRLPEYGSTIRDDYLASPAPVSCELFEISGNGLHTIGTTDQTNE